MRRHDDERGFAIVYLALSISTILVAAAFAVDVGWWYVRAQHAQRAADAAALAAVVWMPGDFPKATSVARATAKANGFEHGVGSISVLVSTGANERQIAVRIVDSNVTRFFSSVGSQGPVTIGRRAVAQYDLPIPLGSAENQLGGGHGGVHTAVNGFCTRRADGDNISSGYYTLNQPTNANITCQTPYDSVSATPPIVKNPGYRASGYTYVVDIPPAVTTGCAVASPPAGCTRTASLVTIEVHDPKTNVAPPPPVQPDQRFNQPLPTAACPAYQATTTFTVFAADDTPLDLRDNPQLSSVSHGTSTASSLWEPLAVIPASSRSGQYLVRVKSTADQPCSAWSNAFGLRARVGSGAFTLCSTQPGSPLPGGYCPQVHGFDMMSLRAFVADSPATCHTPAVATNKCATFYLAEVDPSYAGRKMVISLFDTDEGALRIRILGPDGNKVGFTWKTADSGPAAGGTITSSDGGLAVRSGTTDLFNDRRLELAVDLPDATTLSLNGGWFKVEYEVSATSNVTDRTTWGVGVRGAPVHLVS